MLITENQKSSLNIGLMTPVPRQYSHSHEQVLEILFAVSAATYDIDMYCDLGTIEGWQWAHIKRIM